MWTQTITQFAFTFFLFLCFCLYCAEAKPPHILFILADDFGWNDIGYHQVLNKTTNHIVRTPHLDRLAKEGIKLENYYVQPLCSPSRATLLTGRYPISHGIGPNVNGGPHGPSAPYGLPARETLLPEVLKRFANYESHMIGKWHLGHCDFGYTPTARGFETFTGFYNGAEGYFIPSLVADGNRTFAMKGYDMRFDGSPTELSAAWPLPNESFAEDCYSRNTTACYSTIIYSRAAEAIVKRFVLSNNLARKRLFLYVAFQATHNPLTAPDIYVEKYQSIEDYPRRLFAGMTKALDESVKNITDAFKKHGLWNETLLIFSTDNGGEPSPIGRSNNYPLRGGKGTNWEGGVRGVGFIRGTESVGVSWLPQGQVRFQLMHISDWFPTMLFVAGVRDYKSKLSLDGYNQWKSLSENAPSPRLGIVHNVQPENAVTPTLPNDAIRLGKWKLHVRTKRASAVIPPPGFKGSPRTIPKPYNDSFFLFDIEEDPFEQNNLAFARQDLLDEMLQFYRSIQMRTSGDLFLKWGMIDACADPKLRVDKFWGPSNRTCNTLCRYAREFSM